MSVTIYDVAERAGVAISTVSKVLSGRHAVSDKTRARVMQAIADLNYIPQAAARSLAGDRTSMIGLVITYRPEDFFADPNLVRVLFGVDTQVTEHDYALLLSLPRSADDQVSAFERLLRGYRVDGVLVESGLGEDGVMLLAEQGYPCVVIGYSKNGLPCVYPDDYRGARLMTRHLLDLGHHRIGIINGPESFPIAMQKRLAGFEDELCADGLTFDRDYMVFGNFRQESGYAGIAHLMQLDPPPTAIFAFNDRMAIGALRWLREHGYRVPQDVSLAGFDDISQAAEVDPPLTTIRISPLDIGQRAAAMLFDLIANGNGDGEAVMLPVEFIARASTMPIAETDLRIKTDDT